MRCLVNHQSKAHKDYGDLGGPLAVDPCELRQARKGATAAGCFMRVDVAI